MAGLRAKSVEMALSDGRTLWDRKQVSLDVFMKHRLALKVTEQVYGQENVGGKYYDGSTDSGVVGTEITRIMGLDKDKLAEKGVQSGFQLYMMVVKGNETEEGLPSFCDSNGKNKLIDLNNYDMGNIGELLSKLPQGSKIVLIWQLDVNRTNDVDMEKSVVTDLPNSGVVGHAKAPEFMPSFDPGSSTSEASRRAAHADTILPPKPVGDGGFSNADVLLPNTSVKIERQQDGGEIISISETKLFKGTTIDPVDLKTIAERLIETAKSFDGTPVSLPEMQYILFIVPNGTPLVYDATSNPRVETTVNASLLEILSRQQMDRVSPEYSSDRILVDKQEQPNLAPKPLSPALRTHMPIAPQISQPDTLPPTPRPIQKTNKEPTPRAAETKPAPVLRINHLRRDSLLPISAVTTIGSAFKTAMPKTDEKPREIPREASVVSTRPTPMSKRLPVNRPPTPPSRLTAARRRPQVAFLKSKTLRRPILSAVRRIPHVEFKRLRSARILDPTPAAQISLREPHRTRRSRVDPAIPVQKKPAKQRGRRTAGRTIDPVNKKQQKKHELKLEPRKAAKVQSKIPRKKPIQSDHQVRRNPVAVNPKVIRSNQHTMVFDFRKKKRRFNGRAAAGNLL